MIYNIGDTVKLPKGTLVGMIALRYDTDAKVTHILSRDDNSKYYRVEWIDIKGREKSTYIS